MLQGASIKSETNCARFIAEIIIASSNNKEICNRLKQSMFLNANLIRNVLKSTTTNALYNMYRQEINHYKIGQS
jgi:hypothetical protein